MIIDMHSHWLPEKFVALLKNRETAPKIFTNKDGRDVFDFAIGAIPLEFKYFDINRRLASMKEAGINKSMLSLSGVFGVESLPYHESNILCQTFNDEISNLCSKYPDSFFGIASLPLANLDKALEEFDRAIKLPGMIGILLPGNALLDEQRAKRYTKLFALAQQHKAFIFIHVGLLPNDDSLPPGNDIDNAVARRATLDTQSRLSSIMLTLCLTDFLKNFPDVKIQLHNLGGNIPFEIERLDHISLDRNPNLETPSSKIKKSKVYVDCNSMGSRGIERAIEVYGAERLLFGSDGTDFGVKWSLGALETANITNEQRDLIFYKNANRLFSEELGLRGAN